MVDVCIDRDDQTTQNKLALSPKPIVDQEGRYTLAQIDAVAVDIAESIRNEAETHAPKNTVLS